MNVPVRGHHRKAQHADLVEVRQQGLASRKSGEQPTEHPYHEQREVSDRRHRVDRRRPHVGHAIGHSLDDAAGLLALLGNRDVGVE